MNHVVLDARAPDGVTPSAAATKPRSDAYQLIATMLHKYPNQPVVITPQMAEILLEKHNLHNRPTRQNIIDRYGEDMKNGRWVPNGETIKFDVEGVLVDGQHRLWACFGSETQFETFVAINVPTNAFETIDIGAKRNPADSLAVAGNDKHAKMAAPAIRVIIAYGRKAQGMAMNVAQISNAEVVEYWKANRDIDAVCEYVSKMKPSVKTMVPVSSLISLMFLIGKAGYGEEITHKFCFHLESGLELKEGDAIATLRDKLITRSGKRVKEDVFEVLVWCIRAFNAWVRGAKLANIYGTNTSTRGDSYPPVRPAK